MKLEITEDLVAYVFEDQGKVRVQLRKSSDVSGRLVCKAVTMSQETWQYLNIYIQTIDLHISMSKPTPEPLHLGDDVYMSYGDYKGLSLVHVRHWNRNLKGMLYPTMKGVAFNPESWAVFKKARKDISEYLKAYMESDNVFMNTPFNPKLHVQFPQTASSSP